MQVMSLSGEMDYHNIIHWILQNMQVILLNKELRKLHLQYFLYDFKHFSNY
jgi:hypothetical protein